MAPALASAAILRSGRMPLSWAENESGTASPLRAQFWHRRGRLLGLLPLSIGERGWVRGQFKSRWVRTPSAARAKRERPPPRRGEVARGTAVHRSRRRALVAPR